MVHDMLRNIKCSCFVAVRSAAHGAPFASAIGATGSASGSESDALVPTGDEELEIDTDLPALQVLQVCWIFMRKYEYLVTITVTAFTFPCQCMADSRTYGSTSPSRVAAVTGIIYPSQVKALLTWSATMDAGMSGSLIHAKTHHYLILVHCTSCAGC